MVQNESNSKHRDKVKTLMRWKTQRGEAAYSSVAVVDDVANDALSLVTPGAMLRHG